MRPCTLGAPVSEQPSVRGVGTLGRRRSAARTIFVRAATASSARASALLPEPDRPADEHARLADDQCGGVNGLRATLALRLSASDGGLRSRRRRGQRNDETSAAPCRTASLSSTGGVLGMVAVASAPALSAGARRSWTVLGPDPPAMGFDDLARNRQAEAGILAETLIRTIGVKALENPLERMRRYARPVVFDDDDDLLAAPLRRRRPASTRSRRRATRTSPPGSENERALSIRLVITCASRESCPSTTNTRLARPVLFVARRSSSTINRTLTPLRRGESSAIATTAPQQRDQIDAARRRCAPIRRRAARRRKCR